MSKVGKTPIKLPSGVEITTGGGQVSVKGPKGTLSRELPSVIAITVEDGAATISRTSDEKLARALHGTIRALVANMVVGVSEGFVKKLEIQGVGYRAQLQGQKLVLSVGFCHTIDIEAPAGIEFTVTDPTHIQVSGIDKQLVGQTAAIVRAAHKPEPYKGKGIRYEGEQVRRKAGKAGK